MDNMTGLLLGVGPLILFAIVDTFGNLKTALISALGLAVAELAISLYFFGELDAITLFSFVTLVAFALVSIKLNNPVFFKFQPVLLSCLFGMALIIFYLFDRPILLELVLKYKSFLPADKQHFLEMGPFQSILRYSSLYSGYALLAHGALVAWAALKLNKWWWVTFRVVGFYLLLFIASQMAALKVSLGNS